ncbi:MAG: GntR family transcriptional regulator [Culicoidibacterales bacterium]
MESFDGKLPVYLQVVDLLFTWIVLGQLSPGDQIPTVRKLAADLGVNPNTVQKALQTLEERGIATAVVGRGRFITEDGNLLIEVRDEVITKQVAKFVEKMKIYSLSEAEITQRVHQYIKERMGD